MLRVDDSVSLFESSAITEYLDDTIAPRLHPEDPVQRAVNRAWTDYVPTFSEHVTGVAYADDEAAAKKCTDKIPVAFERLVQWHEIFAGRRRLRAVPAALLFPRPHPSDWTDRQVSAAQGLGADAAQAAVDALVSRNRVRNAVPGEREEAQQVAVAVHRCAGSSGGVSRRLYDRGAAGRVRLNRRKSSGP